jgi:hypothetical protein
VSISIAIRSGYGCLLLVFICGLKPVEGLVPGWVNKPPRSPDFLYAVGRGGTPERSAEHAREEIARSIKVEVSSVVSMKVIEVQLGERSQIKEIYEQQTQAIARESLSGVEILEYCPLGPGRYACLARLPRGEPERIVEEQQKRYGEILSGFLEEGEMAEERGALGTALKHYFRAYSILPLLPKLLYLPREGVGRQEAHSAVFDRIMSLLAERECECEYEPSRLRPDQSVLRLTLHGRGPGSRFDDLALRVTGHEMAVDAHTRREGDFELIAEEWRGGAVVQLEFELFKHSFTPFEGLSAIQKQQFHERIGASFPPMEGTAVCRYKGNLRIFVQIEEFIEGDFMRTGKLERSLKVYISRHPSLQVATEAGNADLRLSGRLEAFSGSVDEILGFGYLATGEAEIFSGELSIRSFESGDSQVSVSWENSARKAGDGALQKVSDLLKGDIQQFLDELGDQP